MKLPIDYSSAHWTTRKAAREEYVRRQRGKCAYCGEPLSGPPAPSVAEKPVCPKLFPKNFFRWPVHLHHCHETGLTIGAVHNYCNAVLWQYYGE